MGGVLRRPQTLLVSAPVGLLNHRHRRPLRNAGTGKRVLADHRAGLSYLCSDPIWPRCRNEISRRHRQRALEQSEGRQGKLQHPAGGAPFEGFRWRTVPELNVNFVWAYLYMTDVSAGHVSKVWFDHIVVATDYIGPIRK